MKLDMFGAVEGIERSISYHLQRHGVLASNLANAETPGYKPKELLFKNAMQDAISMSQTDSGHLQTSGAPGTSSESGELIELPSEGLSPDGNGVSLEREMARVSANRLRHDTAVAIIKRRIAMLRYASTDGGQ